MIDKIIKIKYKLKNNKITSFGVINVNNFKKLEKSLLENGFCWNDRNNNTTLNDYLYSHIQHNACIFVINEKKLQFTYDNESMINSADVVLNDDNIDYFIKNLFVTNQPNYNPRKKIDRSI